MKLRLVTVTGSRTNTLWHMLRHYAHLVDEIYVAVYEWKGSSTFDEVEAIVNKFSNARIVSRNLDEKYNWERVTQLYNEVKMMHPNDWWIISDDDEFHVYSKPLWQIVNDCETQGWDVVRGGFIDRIGVDGTFPELTDEKDIFEQFPDAGFFRYPLSKACPNKICLVKGHIEVTPGQHYAKIDGHTTWKWQGWNHPLIAPVDEYNVQVHHFKWDSTCGERIRAVANTNMAYAYSEEYRKMYRELAKCRFKIDTADSRFMIERGVIHPKHEQYKQWSKLWKIIQAI